MKKRICGVMIGVTFGVALTGHADPVEATDAKRSLPRELTLSDLAILDSAESILISRCMKERGFTYVPSQKPVTEERNFRYVIDDVAWAGEHGYGGEDRRHTEEASKNDPNRQYFDRLPPEKQRAALAALNGERPEGLSAEIPFLGVITASDQSCRAEAQRRLYGDLATWFRLDVLTTNLPAAYVPKVDQDRRFAKAVTNWSRCMRRAGHQYQNPDQLRETLDRGHLGKTWEVRLAVAEARCARSSALGKTARELDRYYGDQVREQYREEIATQRRLQLAALPLAREITALQQDTTQDTGLEASALAK